MPDKLPGRPRHDSSLTRTTKATKPKNQFPIFRARHVYKERCTGDQLQRPQKRNFKSRINGRSNGSLAAFTSMTVRKS